VFSWIGKASEIPLDLKNTKILMYKVLIRPVLTCASETWTLFKTNERQLNLFERKLFDVFFERNKRTKYGGKYTTVNCTKHLMNQTLSITSKSKD
jgi:hypothetical protein